MRQPKPSSAHDTQLTKAGKPRLRAPGAGALRLAIVSAVGCFVHYDIHGALEIAADIADDVNAHPEAAQIRAMVI
jgi:hypothetical protein